MSDAARLADALAALALPLWPTLDDDERRAGGAALAAFVSAPTAARFVAAARQLNQARRRRRALELDRALGERAFARGAARLAAVPFLDEATRATLVGGSRDAGAGRRLATLAALLDAHAELAARLRSVDAAHVPLPLDDERRR